MNEEIIGEKDDILKRLRRIEGQVKGIYKMIEEEKGCVEVLTQVAAVRAAINKVGGLILEKHSLDCIRKVVSSDDRENALCELTKTMQSFMRFID